VGNILPEVPMRQWLISFPFTGQVQVGDCYWMAGVGCCRSTFIGF